jgi:hypothetical protein
MRIGRELKRDGELLRFDVSCSQRHLPYTEIFVLRWSASIPSDALELPLRKVYDGSRLLNLREKTRDVSTPALRASAQHDVLNLCGCSSRSGGRRPTPW